MRRFPGVMLAAVVLATAANAQAPAQPAPAQPKVQSTIPPTGTQSVVVDVAVQDKNGHPVRGLKSENFRLTEDKVPQTVLHFVEHSALAPAQPGRELPPMPPGIFTDYTPVPPDGTLNILLLDALNTPTKDQNFIRDELQQYVRQANPGTRIAIFGLANRLVLLQGFTSDPATLKNVVEHKLIPRTSSLLDHPTGSGADQQNRSDPTNTSSAPSSAQLAANLQQFEAETANLETHLRVPFTLDALNTLSHYLAALPGRKNLIWFSGSFPLPILPGPSRQAPSAIAQVNEVELRETIDLLTRARVAVYPIDARGMATPPTHEASSNKPDTSPAAERTTMDELASYTGGRTIYNADDLADAVAKAINAGANYYSLAYSPANRNEDGAYRVIRVDLASAQTGPVPQLSYRHGYYAEDAGHHDKDGEATPTGKATDDQGAAAAYARAAMSRGAPTPQDILFKVRVLPASDTTESAVAPDNTLDASVSPKGPFRRYDLDDVSFPSELTLTLQPDGRRAGTVEFLVYVFDVDGRLLNETGKTFSLNLTPATYARFIRSVIECHLEVSVPTSVATFLRIGIRDVPTNRFGVVEVPTDSVSHLASPVYPKTPAPATPATTPATAPSAPPAPSP